VIVDSCCPKALISTHWPIPVVIDREELPSVSPSFIVVLCKRAAGKIQEQALKRTDHLFHNNAGLIVCCPKIKAAFKAAFY